MRRHSHSSTLFPYTTLFRSLFRILRGGGAAARGPQRQSPQQQEEEPARLRYQPLSDRKSTRLNSSHVKISYAVFCLKKKILEHYIYPLISSSIQIVSHNHKL